MNDLLLNISNRFIRKVIFIIVLTAGLWSCNSFCAVTGTVKKTGKDSISISGLSITGSADWVGTSGVFAGQLSVVYTYKNQIWQGSFGYVDNGRNCDQSYVASQVPGSITISNPRTYSSEQPTQLEVICLVGPLEYLWTGPSNPLEDPVNCTSDLTPSTLNWSMGSNETGTAQQTTLHMVCTETASLHVVTDNSASAGGSKKLDDGVSTTGNNGVLEIKPETYNARSGAYSGAVVITVNFE